jgi:hypothetical protein
MLLVKRAVFISLAHSLKLLEQPVTVTVFPYITLYGSTTESNNSPRPIPY